jgi:hypothetical protein
MPIGDPQLAAAENLTNSRPEQVQHIGVVDPSEISVAAYPH